MVGYYRYIIWDWNGTLLDDAHYSLRIVNELLGRRGMPPVTLERYLNVFGFPVADYVRRLGLGTKAESQSISHEFMELYEAERQRCSLRGDAVIVLGLLRENGIQQAILSAYRQQALRDVVAELDIDSYFHAIVGVDNDHAFGKISRGLRWFAQSGWPRDQTVLCGDTDYDQKVARSLGVNCLLVEGGHQSRERLLATGAEVVGRLRDIPDRIGCRISV